MNYQKLDAALSAALQEIDNEDAPHFKIFIHVHAIAASEIKTQLEQLGIHAAPSEIVTATVSEQKIAELSEQPWVKALRLSRVLYPLQRRPEEAIAPYTMPLKF